MQTTAQTSAKACTTTAPIIPLLYSSRHLIPSARRLIPPTTPSPLSSHSTPFTIRTGSGHGFSHAVCFPIDGNPFPAVAGVNTRHHTSIPITTVGFVESRYHTNHTRPSQSAFAPCIPHPRSVELQEPSPYLFTPIDLEYRDQKGRRPDGIPAQKTI
jgi:hypothetical protein